MDDAWQRSRALDPLRSFIVQAPAGSGKTELLIQRYLALLARVEAPEEIVAITFTRKAAGEMRERVLDALVTARGERPPQTDHERRTWELARAARERDAQAGWGIGTSPGRLRIQTIDSLCAGLTRQMPVLSGFGAQPESVEDASALYLEAARRTLDQLETAGPWSAAVGRVLLHLDNNVEIAERLLASMLARRDQWLRHVADSQSRRLRRDTLEEALANLTLDALEALREQVPEELVPELLALARFAAANLAQPGSESVIRELQGIHELPGATPADLPRWRAIAELLLVKDGGLRQEANATLGFPAPSGERDSARKARLQDYKARFEALLATLRAHAGFIEELDLTRKLPPAAYSTVQWEVVEALTQVLPIAVAELELLFRERGQVDFTAVSQAAVRALGGEDEPTDLGLALDYRIRHLLVDEFQDTSQSQYELLVHLTAGWQPGDGRTLFVVGDPMQSIYRFREAEVALYLRARREGIGAVRLEPLTLSTNFRSQAGLVEWANGCFQRVLPEREDLASGAVPFAPSHAIHAGLPGEAVTVHALLDDDREAEAELVARLVRAARSEDAKQRVAILVRARTHLDAIVPALKRAGLRFQAIEVESLGQRPVVRDLHALTRALLHAGDRVAWLALLRAPWCGLTLADLEALAGREHDACIWDLAQRPDVLARMSQDGQARLVHVRERLRTCIAQRRREPLRRWIEGAWLALGGPAAAQGPADLDDAQVFLGLLDELEEGGDLPDFAALAERVSKLHAQPDPGADETLQLMTIHKAKGLEFDTVILPGLGRAPHAKDPRLLLWLERPRARRGSDLLLAPIRERSQQADPIYAYLDVLDSAKQAHEDGRLLYVAATRARNRLHLIGHAQIRDKGVQADGRSLLKQLWPVVGEAFEQAAAGLTAGSMQAEQATIVPESVIRRVVSGWEPPLPPPGTVATRAWAELGAMFEEVEFSWASETARHVGTVVHRMLQTIAEEGIDAWNAPRVAGLREVFARDLRLLGVPETELPGARERVVAALAGALEDERARWILSPHSEARSEWRLSGVLDGEVVDVAIDRTFVDEQGRRWIIDYKTGTHEGGDLDAFLDREQARYREQLERYAKILARLDPRPVRLALYFPLLHGWREWAV
jgi:ATP-dependent exoDNAse (exonuclease V) beta subunit